MECYPDKAQYRPGETVRIRVEAPVECARIEAVLWELHRKVAHLAGEPGRPLTWQAPPCTWRAFGVECRALDSAGRLLEEGFTAFAVADHWSRAPRFGFMTDFSATETLRETRRRVDLLSRLHINCLHFYDWFYSHHCYLPPEDNFVDALGRDLSLIVVRRKIRIAHEAGIVALAYGPLYAAEESLVKDHPDWALYRSDGVPFNVARLFYIMDFRPGRPWTNHILQEYVRAVTALGFDGIQIEQYGYPKRALPYPGQMGQPSIDLSDYFLPFIQQAQAAIAAAKPGSRVVFNAVNSWPLQKVASGPQAANYIQVFAPHDTYRDLYELIRTARTLAPDKPVILAAYLKPFATEPPEKAENALRLLTAVTHAAGGYHMAIGEGEGVLTTGYFPDYVRLRPEGLQVMRRYYDFVVRYGPLLQAPPEADVSITHGGGITAVYSFAGAPTSPIPTPGTVWTVIREHTGLISINLVNLTGSRSGRWNEGQAPPPVISSLHVACKVLEPVTAVYVASPDEAGGKLVPLTFEVVPDAHTGHVLRFRVPPLHYWSLVIIVQ